MKIVLNKPTSGFNLAAINDNFDKIEEALQEQVLYRNNPVGEPNTVQTDIDMNGKTILNLAALQVGGINVDGLNSAVVWRGVWSGATAYVRSDAVYYNGSSYICVTPNTNSAPPSANWNLFAAQGATGAGSGDVLGPASATLDHLATYANGTGKLLKNSGVTISALAVAGPLASSGITGAAASGANNDITSLGALGSIPNGTVTNLPTVTGAFKSLAASATGLSASVSVSADEVVLSNASNQYVTLRSVSLTVAGTSVGANALDTGSVAASTWYSLWVIWNGTTTAGLLSLSAAAPTMPSGYTHKARVGWIRTDGTANRFPLGFRQFGRQVRYVVAAGSNVTALPMMASGSAGTPNIPTRAEVATGAFIPTTAGVIHGTFGSNNASLNTIVAPNTSYGSYGSTTNPPPASTNTSATNIPFSFAVESANIHWASGGGGATLQCIGWEDNL
jgi:hypothetical protein